MKSSDRNSEIRGALKGWASFTLFKKDIGRFWPIWGIYTAIWFFLLPMEIIRMGSGRGVLSGLAQAAAREQAVDLLHGACVESVMLGAVFGLLAAMAFFSYLMDPKACQLFHGLPIRREGLFITHWLSGLWCFAVPNAVIALISTVAGLVCRVPVFPDVWLWWLIATVIGMFFFCFAAFCAMFTGHILALPVFYGIVNVLIMGLCFMADIGLELLLVGYAGSSLRSTAFARWCTPGYHLLYLLQDPYAGEGTGLSASMYSPVGAVCYCLVLGAVFTVIAAALYRFRQLERAGDLVTVGWVRPVFQYGFGTCMGCCLGFIIYSNFFYGSKWTFIGLAVACAAVAAFAGRMMLKKTLRVFREGWKGVAVFALALLALLGGAKADFFGVQRWVPAPADVKHVQVRGVDSSPYDSYSGFEVSDPEDVAAVIEFHKALVSDLRALEEAEGWQTTTDVDGYETKGYTGAWLIYTLTDGRMVRRYYDDVPITAEALTDEESYGYLLQELLNRPNTVLSAYLPTWWEGEPEEFSVVDGYLDNVRVSEGWTEVEPVPEDGPQAAAVESDDGDGDLAPAVAEKSVTTVSEDMPYEQLDLETGAAQALWQAVLADMRDGDLGRRYLLDDKARYDNCYQSDLVLTLGRDVVVGGKRQYETERVRIGLQRSAARTMAELEELGLTGYLVEWHPEKWEK